MKKLMLLQVLKNAGCDLTTEMKSLENKIKNIVTKMETDCENEIKNI